MIVFDDKRQTATASTMTDLIIKIKLYHKNFSEILDGISEYSSKWILVSRILSENTKGNYTEKYVSFLKLKNHVKNYNHKSEKIFPSVTTILRAFVVGIILKGITYVPTETA